LKRGGSGDTGGDIDNCFDRGDNNCCVAQAGRYDAGGWRASLEDAEEIWWAGKDLTGKGVDVDVDLDMILDGNLV
jgi:hypothetical protein